MGNRESSSSSSGTSSDRSSDNRSSSSSSSSSNSSSNRVLVVGLHDSGKSHFIQTVTCDGYGKEDAPTFGLYESSTTYKRQRVTFCEMPPSSLYLLPDIAERGDISIVMWVVDAHDTQTDVYDGRNTFLHVVASLASQEARLCLVHNVGRPHPVRRVAIHGAYKEPASQAATTTTERCMSWEEVLAVFLDACKDRPRYATQISYTDAKTPIALMDWITGRL